MIAYRPRRMAPAPLVALVLVAGAVLAACQATSPSTAPSASASTGGGGSEPTDSPSAPLSGSPSAAPDDEPSADPGDFACSMPVTGVGSTALAQIIDVRVGEHDGYDRIVFEFTEGIPQFTIDEAEPPFIQDGSGFPVEVDGKVFWQIRLDGGTKQGPDGDPTYDGPTEFEPGFSSLVHLVEGGDFEAVSTWYVGLEAASCIRVLTLPDPFRLVVDIEHG